MNRLRKVGFGEVRYPGLIREDDAATLIDGLCRRCHASINRERDENESAFDGLKVPAEGWDPAEVEPWDPVKVDDYVEGCQLCELDGAFRLAEEELEKVGIYS